MEARVLKYWSAPALLASNRVWIPGSVAQSRVSAMSLSTPALHPRSAATHRTVIPGSPRTRSRFSSRSRSSERAESTRTEPGARWGATERARARPKPRDAPVMMTSALPKPEPDPDPDPEPEPGPALIPNKLILTTSTGAERESARADEYMCVSVTWSIRHAPGRQTPRFMRRDHNKRVSFEWMNLLNMLQNRKKMCGIF